MRCGFARWKYMYKIWNNKLIVKNKCAFGSTVSPSKVLNYKHPISNVKSSTTSIVNETTKRPTARKSLSDNLTKNSKNNKIGSPRKLPLETVSQHMTSRKTPMKDTTYLSHNNYYNNTSNNTSTTTNHSNTNTKVTFHSDRFRNTSYPLLQNTNNTNSSSSIDDLMNDYEKSHFSYVIHNIQRYNSSNNILPKYFNIWRKHALYLKQLRQKEVYLNAYTLMNIQSYYFDIWMKSCPTIICKKTLWIIPKVIISKLPQERVLVPRNSFM
jgi:hypothetical protein